MSTTWQPPAASGVTEESLRKSRLIANLVMLALALCVVLGVVRVLSDYSYGNLIQKILSGGNVTLDQANAADHRVNTLAWVDIGLYVVTGILFIVWFRDAYRNVGRLGVSGLRWGPGWAVGAWFVPFLNLVRPKAMLNDIWRGSNPALANGTTLGERVGSPPGMYQVWWGVWIISALFGRIAYAQFNHASTPDALKSGTHMLMASDVIEIIGALLAIAVVRSLSSRQRARAAALAGSASAAGS